VEAICICRAESQDGHARAVMRYCRRPVWVGHCRSNDLAPSLCYLYFGGHRCRERPVCAALQSVKTWFARSCGWPHARSRADVRNDWSQSGADVARRRALGDKFSEADYW